MRGVSSDNRTRWIGADVAGDGGLTGSVSASQAAEEANNAAPGAVRQVLEEVDKFDVTAADIQSAAAG